MTFRRDINGTISHKSEHLGNEQSLVPKTKIAFNDLEYADRSLLQEHTMCNLSFHKYIISVLMISTNKTSS